MKPTLLITDDDEEIRSQMKWALNADYQVHLAEDRAGALEAFRLHHPRVMLLDLGLPPNPGNPEEGLETLGEILSLDPRVKIIIISGQSERANALEAVGRGAYDFLAKPVEMDELKIILKRAFHVAELEHEFHKMERWLKEDTFEGMLGTSRPMQEVFASIRKVSGTDAPVLILGESGTGKEMAALAIHRRSPRRDGPFVPINCAAIPDTLLESELFGHEKGSFTGAHAQRVGRIETAHQGTLFLDEIGELPPPLQVKLLRFLQEQKLQRVGGRKEIPIDARVIAATNSDLHQAMAKGTFREDLFYRLAVVVIKLPALRERGGDIELLAQAFLRRFTSDLGKGALKFNRDTLRAIQRHTWPGNVRELENRIRRAVIMADGHFIALSDLELDSSMVLSAPRSLKEGREEIERTMINEALQRHRGKISPAASDLGISRPTFYELMEKLGIKKESDHD